MAILQISRITHRKGVMENLPQLAGAEFGWALDERRLFIGNGLLEDGAPVIGNTEILTEFSDILGLASTYTYKGTRAGYIVNTGDPDDIVRSLQERFDERVSVLSFGAKGDGVTDDTDAINRAYYELFCRQGNTEVRRALYFPAGKYIVKDTIKLPPHSLTIGDGLTSSIISYVSPDGGTTVAPHVVVTSDSLHQTGINLGNNGATPPVGVEMYSMGIESNQPNVPLLIDSAVKSSFGYLDIRGNLLVGDLSNAIAGTAAIRVVSTNSIRPGDITLNKVVTGNTTYGLEINHECKGLVFENGKMNFHFKGANIGETPVGAGPTGVNISRTVFDNITTEGIYVGSTIGMCSSAFNLFYNVGNSLGATPATPNINFENAGNVSIGDLFERTDVQNETVPRIQINGTASIALDNTHAIKLGTYQREVGLSADVLNNTAGTLFSISSPSQSTTFKVDYTVRRADRIMTGELTVANSSTASQFQWEDDTTSSTVAVGFIGVTLTPVDQGGGSTDVDYTVDALGDDATINFSIVRLD